MSCPSIRWKADVRLAHLPDDVQPGLQPVEKVSRAFPRVEHLDQERDPGFPRQRRRALEVLHRGPAQEPVGNAGGAIARQDVQAPATHALRHPHRVLDRAEKMIAPGGVAEVPAVARREVPALGIEEHELEPVPLQLLLHGASVDGVDEQELDRAKPRGGRALETLEKGHLVEEHRQVRGVADHRSVVSRVCR
jgi:hypothetical protein